MDGKYRHIQVKLLKGKQTLAYRRGYYADDLETALAAGQKPDTDPLLMLMGRNLPDYSQILYKIRWCPQTRSPRPTRHASAATPTSKDHSPATAVDFAISPQDLKLESTPDGARHGNIEIVLLAYDREGKPLNFVVTKGDVNLDAKLYASVQQVGLQIHKEIDVPKGIRLPAHRHLRSEVKHRRHARGSGNRCCCNRRQVTTHPTQVDDCSGLSGCLAITVVSKAIALA